MTHTASRIGMLFSSTKRRRILKALRLYPRDAAIRLGLSNGWSGYGRFIILCAPRTGSNYLRSLLNSHSAAVAFGEIFRSTTSIGWDLPGFSQSNRLISLMNMHPRTFLEAAVFRNMPVHIHAVGFKLFYQQARDGRRKFIWDHLEKNRSVKIIHLKRENALKAYLSLVRARDTGVWHVTARRPVEAPPVRLEFEACANHFINMREYRRYVEKHFQHHAKIDVLYEDLSADPDREMERVLNLLGLELEKTRSAVVKQSSRPLHQAISNYHELKQRFKSTPWESYFEDET